MAVAVLRTGVEDETLGRTASSNHRLGCLGPLTTNVDVVEGRKNQLLFW